MCLLVLYTNTNPRNKHDELHKTKVAELPPINPFDWGYMFRPQIWIWINLSPGHSFSAKVTWLHLVPHIPTYGVALMRCGENFISQKLQSTLVPTFEDYLGSPGQSFSCKIVNRVWANRGKGLAWRDHRALEGQYLTIST